MSSVAEALQFEGSQPAPHAGAESPLPHNARGAQPGGTCVSMTTYNSSPLLPADPAATPRPLGYLTLHGTAATPAAAPASRRRPPTSSPDPPPAPAHLSIFLALSRPPTDPATPPSPATPPPRGSPRPTPSPSFFAASGPAGHNVRAWLSRVPPTACPPERPVANASLAANCAAAWDTLRMEVPAEAFSCSREEGGAGEGWEDEIHHTVLFLTLQVALAEEACAPHSLLATAGPPHDAVAPGCTFVTLTATCRPRSCPASTTPSAFAAPSAQPAPAGGASHPPSTTNHIAVPKSPPPPPPAARRGGRRPAAGAWEGAVTWSAYIPDGVQPVRGQLPGVVVAAAEEEGAPPGGAAGGGVDVGAAAAAGGWAGPVDAAVAAATRGSDDRDAAQHGTGEAPPPYDGDDVYGGAAGWEEGDAAVLEEGDLEAYAYDDEDGEEEEAEWEQVGEWEYDAADAWEYYTYREYVNEVVRQWVARAGAGVGRRCGAFGRALRAVRPAAVAGGAALTLLAAVAVGQGLGAALKLMSRAEGRRRERSRQQRRLAEQQQQQQQQQEEQEEHEQHRPRGVGSSAAEAGEPEGGPPGSGARLWWAPEAPHATARLALPPLAAPPPPRPPLRLPSLPRTRSHRQLMSGSEPYGLSAGAALGTCSTAPCSPVSGRSPANSARTSLSGGAAFPQPSPLEWAAFQRAAAARATALSGAAGGASLGGRPAPFQGGRRRRCGSTAAAASVTAPGCVAADGGRGGGGGSRISGSCPGSALPSAARGAQGSGRPSLGAAARPTGAAAAASQATAAGGGGGGGLGGGGMRRFYPALAAGGGGTAAALAAAAAKAPAVGGPEVGFPEAAAGGPERVAVAGVASLLASPIAGVRPHDPAPSCPGAAGGGAPAAAEGGAQSALGLEARSCPGGVPAPAAVALPALHCDGGGSPLAGPQRVERRVGRSRFGSAPAAVAVSEAPAAVAAPEAAAPDVA